MTATYYLIVMAKKNPQNTITSVWLSRGYKRRLKTAAKRQKLSMSAFIRWLFDVYEKANKQLEENGNKESRAS